jgi:hypothetical protein
MNADQKAQLLEQHVTAAMELWADSRPRHAQTLERVVGASDIGGCREYVRRLVVGADFTDERDTWAADVGTAVHLIVEEAMQAAMDAGLALSDEEFVSFDDGSDPVITTLPSGFTVPGHPDGLFVDSSIVPDWKTKNGLATIRKAGPSQQEWWQVSLYTLGLHQKGMIARLEDAVVALVYFDRSGKDAVPVVFAKPYDPLDVVAADQWLEDVLYAVRVGEVAMKDKPVSWCEMACPFFTDCRTEDIAVGGGLITDEHLVAMMEQYLDSHAAVKLATQLKEEAKNELIGVSGSTGKATIRWTRVNGSEVPASTRSAYDRINIRRVEEG